MKVFCVSDYRRFGGLTKNKIYDVLETKELYREIIDKKAYLIFDDSGVQRWFYDDYLIPLDEWREIRLKSLID